MKDLIKNIVSGENIEETQTAFFNELMLRSNEVVKEKEKEMRSDLFSERFIKKVSKFNAKKVRRKKVAPKGSKIVGGEVRQMKGSEKIHRKKGAIKMKRTKLKGGAALKRKAAKKQRLSKQLRDRMNIRN